MSARVLFYFIRDSLRASPSAGKFAQLLAAGDRNFEPKDVPFNELVLISAADGITL